MNQFLFDKAHRLHRIPPFRDAHVHIIKNGKALLANELPEVLSAYPKHGVLQVFDMGHKSTTGPMAKGLAAGSLLVKTAVSAIYRKGGYGSFLGIGVESNDEIAGVLTEIAGAGADFIKVISTGIVDIVSGGVTPGGFSQESLTMICRHAAASGLAVSCHANGDDAIRSAVEAGVASIEHGFFVSQETLRIMADKGVAWTPTAYALQSLGRLLPGEKTKYVGEVVARHLEAVAVAAALGVRLRVGTDSGSAGIEPGSSFIEELRLFKQAGLPLERIIDAACMDADDNSSGNYLEVGEDFIETGVISSGAASGNDAAQ